MDARLLRYYNQELRYLREKGGEFAREFPKIAARLGMEGLEVSDPYVERLLEGCAFLAARIQLKQDAEFPRFSQRLLELVYPNFLAPIPAMLVAQITPTADPNLLAGLTVPRDTPLLAPRSSLSRAGFSDTRCEFRTAQPLQLTPLATASADYFLNLADLGIASLALTERPRCGVRVRLALPAGMTVAQLTVDSLRFYLGGQSDVATRLHELLLSSTVGVLVGAPGREAADGNSSGKRRLLPPEAVAAVGYDDADAMLPVTLRGLSGTRLLQEYFAFPQRFLFIDVSGLQAAFAAVGGSSVELIFLLSRPGSGLDGAVEAANFALHCVPAINLFPKRGDRIQVSEGVHEFHVVPDRAAPLDFEVFDVTSVTGFDDNGSERVFQPLFAPDHKAPASQSAYYTLWREPRLVSDSARRDGPRSGYIGTEAFVSLVDPDEAPFAGSLRQLAVKLRCTNRDLSVFMPIGGGPADFTFDAGVPLASVRVVAGPSRPHTALREGGVAWRLINLLSLNYLSLLDGAGGPDDTRHIGAAGDDDGGGSHGDSSRGGHGGGSGQPTDAAATLRDLLSRFPLGQDSAVRRQIEALQGVDARPIVRRHPSGGPIAFSRGIEVRLSVDEMGHVGGSAFLFGAAMHQYLARHVTMNSFVETVLHSLTRGDTMRWKAFPGRRPVL